MAEEVAAIGDTVMQLGTVEFSDVVDKASLNANVERAMTDALDTAMSNAAAAPTSRYDEVTLRDEMAGDLSGSFGDEKERLVAHGMDKDANAEDVQSSSEATAEALSKLMLDLTTWQVTWGVAQAAQKDLSHVLKS